MRQFLKFFLSKNLGEEGERVPLGGRVPPQEGQFGEVAVPSKVQFQYLNVRI